ncbi:MAG: VV A18-like helicase [Solumvirus sp.]|uniref:VV A18-like helicase n=1 Tax=Solumvirus sp. TaxID=2487773 RepID=A0A3G5AG13_9VIRU|nr:MAG: VV A18-like helicase [Solumvirus sp.]
MAARVLRSDLTDTQVLGLKKTLTMIPKTFVPGMKWYSPATEDKEINFYRPAIVDGKTYIDLPYAIANITLNKAINFDCYKQKEPVTIEFKVKLFDYQVEPYKEASQQVKTFGTTTLRLYPGFGKTALGAKLAADLGFLTLVTYHQTTIEEIWKNTFSKFTNAKVWVVGMKNPPKDYNVILCMNTRLTGVLEEVRNKVGTFIIDEAHRLCTASNVEPLLSVHPLYIIAETATLERTDKMESMMFAMCGTHAVNRSNEKKFNVTKLITDIEPKCETDNQGKLKWSSVIKSLALNQDRNSIIINLVLSNLKHKILILCRVKEHVTVLLDLLKKQDIKSDFMMGTKKKYEDSHVLLGTISKIGTGFDEAAFCSSYNGVRIDLLILVTSIKEKSLLEQNVGRVLRSSVPYVIHLFDNHPSLTRHWSSCRKWYEDNMGTITEQKYTGPRTIPEKQGKVVIKIQGKS